MDNPYEGAVVGAGTRIQAGVPIRQVNADRKVNGLLLRGVVITTYVSDTGGHPLADYIGEALNHPTAVYCDVLVNPTLPGQRWFFLNHALVSQPTGGMHRGRLWKPRAATINLSGQPMGDQTANPADLDGDHVLVGFLNDTFDQPIILRGLPHPIVDTGHEEGNLGQRMKLTAVDGDPDFVKHHGAYYGVDNKGNFVLDSTFANDGALSAEGHEADPPKTGDPAPETLGNQIFNLPMESKHQITLWDMTTPATPVEVMKLTIDKDKLELKVTQGASLKVEEDGADAKLTLGNGAVKVAIADHMQPQHVDHTHATGTGPSSKPNEPWDTDINSSQVLVPDTK